MKKHKKAKEFLEEYCEVPFVNYACKRVGVSRNTIYKWRNEDPEFRAEMDKAEKLGTESVTDLTQSKLVGAVQRSEPWAIQFLLRNRHKNYAYPRPKDFWNDLLGKKQVNGFEVHVIKDKEQLARHRKLQAYEEKYGPLDMTKPLTNEIVFKDFSDKKKPLPPTDIVDS